MLETAGTVHKAWLFSNQQKKIPTLLQV